LVSTSGFYQTFALCPSLTSIPSGLFDFNTAVSTSGFHSTFYGCTSLTSIPAGLFDNNVNVSTIGFYRTFFQCTSLETVPSLLFVNNINVSTSGFEGTFQNCTKLQLNRNIFFADGDEGTRFLNRVSNFRDCFNRTSFTGIQGEAPELWDCDFGTETPVTTNLTSLSNYGDIPAGYL